MKVFKTLNKLLLFMLIFKGVSADKPVLIPGEREIIIEEGQQLKIHCTSPKDFEFFFPETGQFINTSEHHLVAANHDPFKKSKTFYRNDTVFGDTGWYGCVDIDKLTDLTEEQFSKDYDDPNASWIYVYVKPRNYHPFVQAEDFITVDAFVGDKLLLPCRPTSPEYHVDLKDDSLQDDTEDWNFDPKYGFLRKKRVGLIDNNQYTCVINETELFLVVVVEHNEFNKPNIHKESINYLVEGEPAKIVCSVSLHGQGQHHDFKWETPTNSELHNITNTLSGTIATSELTIDKLSYDDEGEYVCRVIYHGNKSKQDSVHVIIHDREQSFISLTTESHDRHYSVFADGEIQWVVNINAYPVPKIMWLDPNDHEIIGADWPGSKYNLKVDPQRQTILKINNLHLGDAGVYSLQADNKKLTQHLNFTLRIKSKPIPIKISSKYDFYVIDEPADFSCKFNGYPIPNITWTLRQCTDPDLIHCKEEELLDSSLTVEADHQVSGNVKASIKMSGYIMCNGCNEYGCVPLELQVLASDFDHNGSGIKSNKGTEDPLTLEDDISLSCIASKHNYTDSTVQWYHQNQSISDNDHTRLNKETTNLSYHAILTIKNLTKDDGGYYVCKVKTKFGSEESFKYYLQVHDPVAPIFIEHNLNQSEKTIVRATDRRENYYLKCFAKGIPRPNVTWYKDNKPLVLNNQFSLTANNQTLVIKDLFENDSGTYSCKVKNRYGEIEAHQKFLVQDAEETRFWIYLSVLTVLLIILIVYFCFKIKQEKRIRKNLLDAGLMHFEEGAIECLNPDLTVDDQAELLPYDRKWEFPRERLKLGKQLGSGAFGIVMKGEARGIKQDESVTTVAIKMVRRDAEFAYIKALASELKIMVHLGKHLNVVNLLGACTKNIAKRELYVIVEYCRYGSLDKYLLRNRKTFINQIDPETGKIDPSIGLDKITRSSSVDSNNSRVKYAALSFSRSVTGTVNGTEAVVYTTDQQEVSSVTSDNGFNTNSSQPGWRSNYQGDYKDQHIKPISTQDLLSWAFQVARGMEYLCQRKVLHGDLAARNILLAENNIVKICDFGLAKSMYKDDNYQKKGDGLVPIKWMAIESIRDRIFSTQSDIWSFGIVMWEFFTLAETPYPGMQAEQQYQRLIEGYRMEQPKYSTQDIYAIMLRCWKSKPALRPSFSELVNSIGTLLEEGAKMHYIDLNAPYLDQNTVEISNEKDYLQMMSAPDHSILMSPTNEYVNCPTTTKTDSEYLSMNNSSPYAESGIFSPRPGSNMSNNQFNFPSNGSSTPGRLSDSDENLEYAPMLTKLRLEELEDDDNYLKPIDVNKRREEFMKKREAERRAEKELNFKMKSQRDSGYCNAPKGIELLEIKYVDDETSKDDVDGILKNESQQNKVPFNNYVNVPKKNIEVKKNVPESFMNPSYVFVEEARNKDSGFLR